MSYELLINEIENDSLNESCIPSPGNAIQNLLTLMEQHESAYQMKSGQVLELESGEFFENYDTLLETLLANSTSSQERLEYTEWFFVVREYKTQLDELHKQTVVVNPSQSPPESQQEVESTQKPAYAGFCI